LIRYFSSSDLFILN